MAPRTRQPNHDERTRAKIRSSQLVNVLIRFIKGEVSLSGDQVRAALGLIRKTLPDLAAVTLSGPDGGPIPHAITDARADNLALVADIRRRLAGGDIGEPAAGAGGGATGEAAAE